jgi:hypothetical protein
MSSTITRTQNRRTLLANTLVGVGTSKSITSITKSGTTATITATAHGIAANDWFIVQGADRVPYNGLFKAATVPDANTITCTMEEDPGANAAGTMTLEKVVPPTNPWGDGSTIDGLTSVGALPTATRGELVVRFATTTGPTTACRCSVFRSHTGAPGTWTELTSVDGPVAANTQYIANIEIPGGMFVMPVFWGVRGTAVYVKAVAFEDTAYSAT